MSDGGSGGGSDGGYSLASSDGSAAGIAFSSSDSVSTRRATVGRSLPYGSKERRAAEERRAEEHRAEKRRAAQARERHRAEAVFRATLIAAGCPVSEAGARALRAAGIQLEDMYTMDAATALQRLRRAGPPSVVGMDYHLFPKDAQLIDALDQRRAEELLEAAAAKQRMEVEERIERHQAAAAAAREERTRAASPCTRTTSGWA